MVWFGPSKWVYFIKETLIIPDWLSGNEGLVSHYFLLEANMSPYSLKLRLVSLPFFSELIQKDCPMAHMILT